MQSKIRNKFVKLRKFLNVENFSATTIGQAPVQTKNMIEKYRVEFINGFQNDPIKVTKNLSNMKNHWCTQLDRNAKVRKERKRHRKNLA